MTEFLQFTLTLPLTVSIKSAVLEYAHLGLKYAHLFRAVIRARTMY